MKLKIILTLAFIALLMPVITYAQENTSSLTVNDGGTTHTECGVPLWGPEANYNITVQECEYIIPAESLTAMKYHKICGMTYYLDNPTSYSYIGDELLEVRLMTYNHTTFDGFVDISNATTVYQGILEVVNQEMSIVFDEIYNANFFTYQGGNLLVYTKLTSANPLPIGFSFYGVNLNCQGSAIYRYNDNESEIKNSLPKVTFTFENDVVGMPGPYNLTVSDVTSKSATLSWDCNLDIYKWDVAYRKDAYQYTFDNDEEDWSGVDVDGNGNCWFWNNQYMRSLFTNNDKNTGKDYLLSPVVTLGGSLSFKVRGGSTGYQDSFEVYVTTNDNLDVSEYTKIYESPSITSNANWLPFEVDLSSYKGQTGRVAIRHLNGLDASFLDIDDISITEPWTIVNNVSEKTCPLENLEQETTYLVRVRSAYGNSVGGWSEPVDFDTKAAINISSAGWATFCWNEPLDFSNNEDLKVYCIGSLEDSGNGTKVKLTNITFVPENTGVLIKGNAGQYEIPGTATSSDDVTEGDDFAFVGVNEPTEISPTDGEFTNFILAMVDGNVGFYKVASTGVLAAHKAYLKIKLGSLQADVITFVEDDEDGISYVRENPSAEEIWFTIGGVRIHEPRQPGLYIRNGEKVVVK